MRSRRPPTKIALLRAELLDARAKDTERGSYGEAFLPPTPARSSSWLELAACRHRPSSWWYSTPGSFETAVAVSICRCCPVRQECLAAALSEEVDGAAYGVRGGLTAGARRALG